MAICYTHQICFSWRKSNFCRECSHVSQAYQISRTSSRSCLYILRYLSCACLHTTALKCPLGKEYKPCVNTCKTMTCQNRDYYEESVCTSIREECVCKSGTILHRADSAFCVTEEQCGEKSRAHDLVISCLSIKDMLLGFYLLNIYLHILLILFNCGI